MCSEECREEDSEGSEGGQEEAEAGEGAGLKGQVQTRREAQVGLKTILETPKEVKGPELIVKNLREMTHN